jgi:hypothetical protein
LTLHCTGLPRPIHIPASNEDVGVTVRDLLQDLYAHLRTGISQKQFLALSIDQRQRVSTNYENRYRRHPDRLTEKSKGLKFVDRVHGMRWLGLTATQLGPDVFMVNLA